MVHAPYGGDRRGDRSGRGRRPSPQISPTHPERSLPRRSRPLHRELREYVCLDALAVAFPSMLSGSTDLIRTRAARPDTRSRFRLSTPSSARRRDPRQPAGHQDIVAQLPVGRDIDLLVRGRCRPMTAAPTGPTKRPIAPLLDAYLTRFPRADRTLGEGPTDDRRGGRWSFVPTPMAVVAPMNGGLIADVAGGVGRARCRLVRPALRVSLLVASRPVRR